MCAVRIKYKSSFCLHVTSLHTFFIAWFIFMSYLVYCFSVWASTYPKNLNRIVILQKNVQLSNKQILFNMFDDSLPMQMPNSTQSKLCLLVLLQKKYVYTCKNIVTKPNLDEFLSKLFEQYRIENCGKNY